VSAREASFRTMARNKSKGKKKPQYEFHKSCHSFREDNLHVAISRQLVPIGR